MKAELTNDGGLRLEGETPQENEFLRRLHSGLTKPREAHFEMFRRVYPFRKGILGKYLAQKRRELWGKWLTINTPVSSAHFHDGSVIIDVKESEPVTNS